MLLSIVLLSLFRASQAVSISSTSAPEGCCTVSSDKDWPSNDIWQDQLPEAVPKSKLQFPWSKSHPDYHVVARSVHDVQKAVEFAGRYNIRVSIINSGHDYMGRNDASDGLWLDVSHLLGVKVGYFEPTMTGQNVPDPSGKVNVFNFSSSDSRQKSATLGTGMSAVEVNKALKASGVFAVSGAAPGVRISGGWGQHGGHGPLTNQYGIGVDQWLEFKVVLANGTLVVANKMSNPDLFWAFRGGGGGTFGVVVQATVKVYDNVPVIAYSWYLKSKTASALHSIVGHNTSESLVDAAVHLASNIPHLADSGSSAYLYMYPASMRGFVIASGENATVSFVRSLWDPVLHKMSSFGDNEPTIRHILRFENYQEFFDYTYLGGRETGCYTTMYETGHISTPTFMSSSCASSASKLADMTTVGRPVRHAISPPGKFPYFDSVFLSKKVLQHPDLKKTLMSQPMTFGWLMLSGNKAHRPDDETSVHPGWREAYVHNMGVSVPGLLSQEPFRNLDPSAGSYGNEGSPSLQEWKHRFWGSNYPRLSEIKTKYDPNMVFWSSPGINADLMELRDGRLCRADINKSQAKFVTSAPDNGNVNRANPLISKNEMFAGVELWADDTDQVLEGTVRYKGASA